MSRSNIYANDKTKEFHIHGKDFSYIFHVLKNGQLGHLYYGEKLMERESFLHQCYHGVYANTCTVFEDDETFSLDLISHEFPSYGTSDYRQPAIEIIQENGSHIVDFKYVSHTVYNGKKSLNRLPSTFDNKDDEATTLEITLKDSVMDVALVLKYTLFKESDVLVRGSEIINNSHERLQVKRFLSMSFDLPEADYEMITLTGGWSRERHMQIHELHNGIQSISSTNGTSSSVANPFFALKKKYTTEHSGETYGFNLVYSGNHVGQVEVTTFGQARVQQGINYFNFNWLLEKDEALETPEVVMIYSNQGLNHMSQKFHAFYSKHLISQKWINENRPVLVNNWEATYFDFNEEKIMKLATISKKIGAELFVLDDGWFGKRNNDKSSLGDWFCNLDKLPGGLKGLSEKVCAIGLKFGFWIEPEMVSPDSDLFRMHPEWVIQVENRPLSYGRNQFVLDFSNNEVVDYICECISKVIIEAENISYVKWDWNRTMTEIGSLKLPASRQQEVAHRYVLGMYELYNRLTNKFPNIIIEGCAGGGSRFDPGILYHSPQIWTSDDTDAVERLKIQYGTSMCYPISTMGAHVSAVPNHQVNRITSLKMRGDVAFFGVLGYELDLTKMSESELTEISEQIEWYKQHRNLLLQGTFYRIKSPFEYNGNETAWAVVSKDKTEAVVGYYKVLAEPNKLPIRLKIYGLESDTEYKLIGTNRTYIGKELQNWGVELSTVLMSELGILNEVKGDFTSVVLEFKKF
jgi:alpha-galactosidase